MRRNSENLKKISELCEYLPDRDLRLKEEHSLLRKMIEDLPLKIFAIKIDKEMKISTQIGTNVPSLSGKNLLDVFEKDSDYILSYHKTMTGEKTKTILNLNGNKFNCVNNAIKSEDGKVNSVVSIAWSCE